MKTAMLLLLGLVMLPAAAVGPSRAQMQEAERAINRRLETLFDEPFMLLGMARGVYLENYGTVFSAEVNLAAGFTGVTPFKLRVTPEELEQVRQKKLERLKPLRAAMEQMLADTAATLKDLPPNEQVVLGVSLFNRSIESTQGLPGQILLRGQKSALLAAKAQGKLAAAITVREY
ncbi:MAG: hypothetical protein MUC42_10450 [Bryobacter sp.]|jgi:predicted alpha/beta-fold hydrolase|nr:hypothetical protein [Bryobacter sp.]